MKLKDDFLILGTICFLVAVSFKAGEPPVNLDDALPVATGVQLEDLKEYFPPDYIELAQVEEEKLILAPPLPRQKPPVPEWVLENYEFNQQLAESLTTNGAE